MLEDGDISCGLMKLSWNGLVIMTILIIGGKTGMLTVTYLGLQHHAVG